MFESSSMDCFVSQYSYCFNMQRLSQTLFQTAMIVKSRRIKIPFQPTHLHFVTF
jgi:hypothetical protein